jgi:hypothetical protein
MFVPKAGEAVIVRWDQGYGSVEVVEEVLIDHFTIYDRLAESYVAVSFMSAHPLLPDGSHGTALFDRKTGSG